MAFTYNSRNWRASMTDPLNRRTDYTYDEAGNLLTLKRPGSVITSHTYDAANRRVTTTDPKLQVTRFEYDGLGKLTKLTDARGNAYIHTYDNNGRQTRLTYPDSSYEAWTYDAAGNRASQRTRAGQIATATFDIRNRETALDWSDSTPDISRSYDVAGRLLSSTNGAATTSYSYDSANQVLTETQATAGAPAAYTLAYTYNADGLRESVTYPSGEVVETAYTGRNQVKSISAAGPPPVAAYSYYLDGTLSERTLENGITSYHVYDAANQLTELYHHRNAVVFSQRNYTYLARGLRSAMQVDGGLWDAYSYDLTDQLTSVKYQAATSTGTTPASTVNYTYEPVGNRTQVKKIVPNEPTVTDTYATASVTNAYTTANGASIGSDLNGNVTSVPANLLLQAAAQTLDYDAQNRLLSIATGSSSLGQVYDTRNRVVARTVNGVTTYLVWDGWNLVEERDSIGALVRRYIHGARVDEVLAMVDADGVHYYLQDALGSSTALTDGAGQIEERYTYDAFGKVTVMDTATGFVGDESFHGNRFLYTGREWLAEAGLYDYRNRVYSVTLGRFLQADPIGFSADDLNLYRYTFNNPINWTDPSGLLVEGPFAGALARAAAGAAVGAGAGSFIGGVGAGPGAVIGAIVGLLLTPSTANAPTMTDAPKVDTQSWKGPLNSKERQFRDAEDDCLKQLEKYEDACSDELSQQERDDFMRSCMDGKGQNYP